MFLQARFYVHTLKSISYIYMLLFIQVDRNGRKYIPKSNYLWHWLSSVFLLARSLSFSLKLISSASNIISVVDKDLGRCYDHESRSEEAELPVYFPPCSRVAFDFSSTRCGSADFIDVVAELAISRNDLGSYTTLVVTPPCHVIEDQTTAWHKAQPAGFSLDNR